MANIFTVKPVISSKYLLANVLALGEAFGDDPNAIIPEGVLTERLGLHIFEKMELFKDKAYFHKAVEYVKGNNLIAETAKKLRNTLPISQFMGDVEDSINEGYITFTNIGIVKGDYVFILKEEFCLANFIASRKIDAKENIDFQQEVNAILIDFRIDKNLITMKMNFLIKSNQFEDFKSFSATLLDTTLREGLKTIKLDDHIKVLINGGLGKFVIL